MEIKVGQIWKYQIGSKPFHEKITDIVNGKCYYEIIFSESGIFKVGETDNEQVGRYKSLIKSLRGKLINNFNDYYNAV